MCLEKCDRGRKLVLITDMSGALRRAFSGVLGDPRICMR
jgi:hypothetical protein